MKLDKNLLIYLLLCFGLTAQTAANADEVLHPDEAMVPSVEVNQNRIDVIFCLAF